ncbi:MAG: tyrosine-type recombinase/integrase [Aulosira sp. DedQUE10]|nr:tyrosine-type recombinase/integrase [Aulosira sp. DedQUE10]
MVAQEDKWISVDKQSGNLAIRFRVKGFYKQFYIASRLPDIKRNREVVRNKRDAIVNDITLGRFDATLESYQFQPTATAPAALVPKKPKKQPDYSLGELWEKFTEFQSHQLERTTIKGNYHAIARCIKSLPTQKLTEATVIRNWLLGSTTYFMSWHCILKFNQCCKWAQSEGLISENPFEKLKVTKPKKKSDKGDRKAFTLEQRDLIIKSFEQHDRHRHYASLIKFLFWTGCRPGEAFALTWGDISPDCRRILINKSRNLHGISKGTKNGKSRVFPCAEGSKLQELLLPLREGREDEEIIFLSKQNSRMTSAILNNVWNRSASMLNGRVKHFSGVVKELSDKGLLPYLKPYATRHTFATWAIATGNSPDKVAYWIGDDVATVLKYYVHPEVSKVDCPDF